MMMETPAATETAGPRRMASFVNAEHFADSALRRMREWFAAVPAQPLVIRDFLRPDKAAQIAAVLRDLPVWERYCTVYEGTLDSRGVPEEEWHDHPQRAACHNVARPLLDALEPGAMAAEHQGNLKAFLSFAVLDGTLRDWLGDGVGFALQRKTSIELASYTPGDQIREHQDLFPGRVMAVNFYLDEDYRVGEGSRLGYRNEAGETFYVDPLFNTFSVIPIRDECYHWVEPYKGQGTGRYTVSIGEHRAD